jgi:septum formation protein
MEKTLILASASPRRRQLLEQIRIPFQVLVSEAEEIWHGTRPEEIVKELALLKAKAAANKFSQETGGEALLLGADTVVVRDGEILGKPEDEKDAYEMLHSLQGRSHQVFTGVALLEIEKSGQKIRFLHAEETKVFVHAMTPEEIWDYVRTGEPMDKAGAYGIQGSFAAYIDRIEGDYFNVVGLPLACVYQNLKSWL